MSENDQNEVFNKKSSIPVSSEELFQWHYRPGALRRLLPPWENVEILERTGSIADGDRLVLANKVGPLKLKWVARHEDFIAGKQFVDVQEKGPFAFWRHSHYFKPNSPHSSTLHDQIEYCLPFGVLGKIAGGAFVRKKLHKMFTYRHRVTREDLLLKKKYSLEKQHILIYGQGSLGEQLQALFQTLGHQVELLPSYPDTFQFQPSFLAEKITVLGWEKIDGIIFLPACHSLQAQEFDKEEIILDNLMRELSQLPQPISHFFLLSTTATYGSWREERVDEDSYCDPRSDGSGFLSLEMENRVKSKLEELLPVTRLVLLRTGLILDGKSTAQLTLTSRSYGVSWIALDDLLGSIYHLWATPEVAGVVNLVTLNPMKQKDFKRMLASKFPSSIWRSCLPGPLRKKLSCKRDCELLQHDLWVEPKKLQESDYEYRFHHLEEALSHLSGK